MAQAAGEVKVILAADSTSWSAALDKAQKQLNQLKGAAASAGQSTRKEMSEARGAIALLGEEVGVHLPRHVRSFVAELPGVAGAMSAAFNAVAIFALVSALVEAGRKVAEFVEKNAEAARKNAEAWRSIEAPMRSTNDELQLANDKLANAIAKMEHKPQNGLKEAIDEAIVSADKLADHLNADLAKISATVEAQAPGLLARTLLAQAGTKDVSEHARDLQGELDRTDLAGHKRLDELRKQGADEDTIAAATQEVNAKRKEAIDKALAWANTELAAAEKTQAAAQRGGSSASWISARISSLQGYAGGLSRMSDFVDLTQTNGDLTSRQRTEQAQLEADQNAYELARQAEAQRDRAFDFQRRNSRPFELVEQNSRKAYEEQHANVPNDVARADDALNKILEEQADDVLHLGPRWSEFNRLQAEGNEKAALGAAKFAELEARIQGATGAMSRHAQALAEAALHTQEYIAQREVLEGQLARIAGDKELTEPQRATQTIQVRNQIEGLDSGRQIQEMQDRAAIESSTALGELRDNARRLGVEWTDMGSILSGIVIGSLNKFNETLVHLMTTPHERAGQAFGELGKSIFTDVTKSGLQYLEGTALKGLLGHDPTAKLGTPSNRMYTSTIIEGGAGSGIAGQLTGTSSSSNNQNGSGGLLGQLFGSLFGGMGGDAGGSAADGIDMSDFTGAAFADGGTTPTNMPILVGEEGPEIFMPTTSGRIVPNSQIGGGGTVIHVDARGNNDPAQTIAQFDRYMRSAAPQIAAAANRSMQDSRQRRPSSAR